MKNKTFTRTFNRFVRRVVDPVNLTSEVKNSLWQTYKKGGKDAVKVKLGFAPESIIIPPSMPKSAVSKIKLYQDNRSKGGMIDITLKCGLVFGDMRSVIAHCPNVKSAIEAMRTVKAA